MVGSEVPIEVDVINHDFLWEIHFALLSHLLLIAHFPIPVLLVCSDLGIQLVFEHLDCLNGLLHDKIGKLRIELS